MNMDKLKILYKPLDGLVPYVNNARKHSDKQILQIASSINEFGFTNPVLLDGENGVIAGHGRIEAAKKLGIDSVPVIELAHLSEARKKAYILADNKLANNSEWDFDILENELADLDDIDFSLDLIGFDQNELDAILGETETETEYKNEELDADDYADQMEMKFTLDTSQYFKIKEALAKLNESPEIALMMALNV